MHRWCKQRSQYGDFDPHHHRHEVAVKALEMQQWYMEVLESEAAMLAKFGSLRIWLRSKYGMAWCCIDCAACVIGMAQAS